MTKLLDTDAHAVTAEVFTSDDGSHAFTAFSFQTDADAEPIGIVVMADSAVADGMVASNAGQYVHLHVVCTPDVAARLLEGKVQ